MANNIENEQENIIADGPDYAGVRSVFMYSVCATVLYVPVCIPYCRPW